MTISPPERDPLFDNVSSLPPGNYAPSRLISLNNSSAASAILKPMKMSMDLDRLLRRSLVVIAVSGLAIGAAARLAGYGSLAHQCWFAATVPVAAGLVYSIVRDLAAGRMGVDAIALVSMFGALGLGQPLAGAVIALMYSGGNVLEDFAVGRAERDLRALVDRAPRVAHRRLDHRVEDVPVAQIVVGDTLLVRARRDHR